MNVKEIVAEIKNRLEDKGGVKQVCFVACGGSNAAIFSGYYLLKSESEKMAVSLYTSDEFIHATPKSIGESTVCILCSLNATAETVDALKWAKEKGAITIAMTGSPETEMAENGEYVIVYSNGDDQIYSDSNQANVLRIGFELLHQFEDYPYYDEAMNAYSKIDGLVSDAKTNLLPLAKDFGERFHKDKVFTVLASGALYATAYTMACCHFMEMQQKPAIALHSGEYFHGPFETTDKDEAVVLLKNIGRTRPLDDRVEVFLKEYGEHYTVIDAEEIGLSSLGEHIGEFFSSVIMIPIERFFVHQMSLMTGYDMDNRRYMWKVQY